MRQTILDVMKGIINNDLEARITDIKLTAQTPFFEGGLELDSFAVVELISHIEERYDIEFSDADFLPENFKDLDTFAAVVQGYVEQSA